jgi:hypothetical protein
MKENKRGKENLIKLRAFIRAKKEECKHKKYQKK